MELVVGRGRGRIRGRIAALEKGRFSAVDAKRLGESAASVRSAIGAGLFVGDEGEVLAVAGGDGLELLLVGLGETRSEKREAVREDAGLALEPLRRAFGALGRRLTRGSGRWVLELGTEALQRLVKASGIEGVAQALGEGALLGSYAYTEKKSPPSGKKPPAKTVTLALDVSGSEATAARRGARRARTLAEAVACARDLGNAPGNDLYPESLARRARAFCRESGLRCKVYSVEDLKRKRMGGLLGVGQGSARPPRLIEIEYRPKRRAKRTLVLVGKSITFDTGGVSIKPARGMEDMKFDMCGGAAVLGALRAIAEIGPPIRVIGLLPAAENHVSGSAIRPGDVLETAAGLTVEIVNTDAEGRLVLADALHHARTFRPDAVVDVATLTGACLVALGTTASGLMANDEALAASLEAAASETGERVWRLPIYPEHREAMRSQVADLRNSCGRNAGASTAGAFLSFFTEGLTWAHLDVAGTSWVQQAGGYRAYGATGYGVRLLSRFAETFAKG